jgi:hypothetical protein
VKLTQKQKIYVAVCGLAAGALVVDRLLPGPEEVPAAEAIAVASVPVPAATTDKPAAKSPGPNLVIPAGPSLASRIEEAARAQGYGGKVERDAFRIPDGWRPAAEAASPIVARPDSDKFVREHRLTAVMTAGDRSVALVDGKPVQIGQVLDGFRLVSVEKSSAVWECEGVRATLELPTADNGAKPATTISR